MSVKLAVVVAMCAVLGSAASSAQAGWFSSLEPKIEPIAAAGSPAVDPCCPPRCISYRRHLLCRHICCDPCLPPQSVVLQVTDPCTCCPVEVPVCVPGCCAQPPEMTTHCGLLGRTITEFTWCCGYRVRVVMDRRGDLVVHTYGR